MSDWLILTGILVAVMLSYLAGKRAQRRTANDARTSLQPHYLQGLNYLLNEQPDAAIETFIDALQVNSETLETHLALGNLLRRRGEVGRAIRIHQNLLARPSLSKSQSHQVQLELARDFIKSGLLDRAEMLLLELVEDSAHPERVQCLEYLIDIFCDEKEWLKAVDAVSQLPGRRFASVPDKWRSAQSHFYCELAELALAKADHLLARKYVRLAASADKQSARASIILAKIEIKLNRDKEAVKALKQVFYQDPALIQQTLPLLYECYSRNDDLAELQIYYREVLAQGAASSVALALAELLARQQGSKAAIEFLATQTNGAPSLKLATQMMTLQLQSMSQPDPTLQQIADTIGQLQLNSPQYRCHACGFSGQNMHWSCPGCKTWGSVRPVE